MITDDPDATARITHLGTLTGNHFNDAVVVRISDYLGECFIDRAGTYVLMPEQALALAVRVGAVIFVKAREYARCAAPGDPDWGDPDAVHAAFALLLAEAVADLTRAATPVPNADNGEPR